MRRPPATARSLGLALLACALAAPARADAPSPAPTLSVELNRLEDRGDACRLHFVFTNPTDREFAALTLDLVLFDADGVIAERVALEAAPLLADKTMVKQFDLAGRPCGDIGRVLINDVTACADASGPVEGCIAMIEPRSAGAVELFR